MRPYTRVISSDHTQTVEVETVPLVIGTFQTYGFHEVHTKDGIKHVTSDEFCKLVKKEADAFVKDITHKLSDIDNHSQLENEQS